MKAVFILGWHLKLRSTDLNSTRPVVKKSYRTNSKVKQAQVAVCNKMPRKSHWNNTNWLVLYFSRFSVFIFTDVILVADNLTLDVWGPSYLGLTRSISWLLMPRLLASPGHQQPWYWLCKIGKSWSFTRKDFNYLWHVSVEKWHKMWIHVYVSSQNLACKELIYWVICVCCVAISKTIAACQS